MLIIAGCVFNKLFFVVKLSFDVYLYTRSTYIIRKRFHYLVILLCF